MKKFAFASMEEFDDLDAILSDGQLHVYYNRELPKGCNPGFARIGFERSENGYVVMTDRGIQSEKYENPMDILLKEGEIRFCCMKDMAEFFHAIQPLFLNEDVSENGIRKAESARSVIDRKKLRAITEEECARKTIWPEEIADPIKQKVFGQDAAIDALAEAITINQMKKQEKLLVLAFLGPPATGKSTVGRALAEVMSKLSGNRYGFIEISANEYTQEHMIQKFLGAPPGYVGYGQKTVLEPVRKNEHHIILMNEIEKSHEKILLALMEAMDTGFLGMADNSPAINLNHCILLFTSNLPIDIAQYGAASDFERSEMCKDAFTKHCGRPEISRRIQDFMVFEPLSEEAKVDVIIKFAKEALEDMGAELVRIDEHLMADFLKYKTKYGASELGNYVTRAIGRRMLKNRKPDLVTGKKVMVYGTVDNIEFGITERRSL